MHNIKVVDTSNGSIVKFESDQFLVKGTTYEFHNVEEAAPSPLAQQLFYLPFVKTVYIAQNFIAIEKYNIVEWKDVQEEVAGQIQEYLNSGNTLITKENEKKALPVTVYAESTPNPAVLKFVANKKLVIKTQEFKDIDATQENTIARGLFSFPFIKELFVDENYISIHKHDIVEWQEVTVQLRSYITEQLQAGKEVGESKNIHANTENNHPTTNESSQVIAANNDLGEVSVQIVSILDEYIKPAVASDGGNIAFHSYKEDTGEVKVILQGACSGCPSSTMTLKNGIETMLKEMIPGKINTVVALNG